jgi:hypothetical protein
MRLAFLHLSARDGFLRPLTIGDFFVNHLPVTPTESNVLALLLDDNHGLQRFERIAQARNGLTLMGEVFGRIAKAELAARMCCGRVLLTIKTEKLWKGFVGDDDTWYDFVTEVLPDQFKISTRVAYEAMEFANSKTLTNLPQAELAQIPISNAKTLVRIEKAGTPKPEVIEEAKTTPPRDFKAKHSVETGAMVSKYIKDPDAVPHWRRILDALGGLTPEAAERFANFLESDDLGQRAGDGPDNKIDCILGVIEIEWQNEEEAYASGEVHQQGQHAEEEAPMAARL